MLIFIFYILQFLLSECMISAKKLKVYFRWYCKFHKSEKENLGI